MEEGIISLLVLPPDIIKIGSIHRAHPTVVEYLSTHPELESLMSDGNDQTENDKKQRLLSGTVGDFYFGPPLFQEQRVITSKIAPLLASAGFRVGDGISQSELCRIVGAYIDENNLRAPEDRG